MQTADLPVSVVMGRIRKPIVDLISPAQIKKLEDLERYQEIVDQLNLGAMPPDDEDQPSKVERKSS